MTNTVILFRGSLAEDTELFIAKQYFRNKIYSNRTAIPSNSIVIGRYSVLPFYQELEDDLKLHGSRLINSYSQHRFVADISNWYPNLREYTPRTWLSLQEWIEDPVKDSIENFVLKGYINSRKQLWNTHMFAISKDVTTVWNRLMDDSMISEQGVCIREYIPLLSIKGDFSEVKEEYRFFILNNKVIASGFYWSNHADEIAFSPISPESVPDIWLSDIKEIVSANCNFYTIDVGFTKSGEPILIELNDGQMAGLSCCDTDTFYKELSNGK